MAAHTLLGTVLAVSAKDLDWVLVLARVLDRVLVLVRVLGGRVLARVLDRVLKTVRVLGGRARKGPACTAWARDTGRNGRWGAHSRPHRVWTQPPWARSSSTGSCSSRRRG